jgi:uncharacterized UPF0160 family protein
MVIPRSCGTHDGSFHADEVTACALLLLFDLIDRDKIFRTRNPAKLSECEYVCDVGGVFDPKSKRFDHHQSEYRGDLSSAGMVLHDLLDRKLLDQRTYDFFNRSLIWGVDAHDNGRSSSEPGICTFSHVITNFVPVVYDAPAAEQNKAFFAAVDFAQGHLGRLLKRFQYIHSCREKVEEAMREGKQYLYFDQPMPWMETFFELGGDNHPALFVIMPSGNHWKLRGIPPTMDEKMKVRLPLPEEWAGLLEEPLKKVSGIAGAIFCHKGRFISVWETKEDVFKALEATLSQSQ